MLSEPHSLMLWRCRRARPISSSSSAPKRYFYALALLSLTFSRRSPKHFVSAFQQRPRPALRNKLYSSKWKAVVEVTSFDTKTPMKDDRSDRDNPSGFVDRRAVMTSYFGAATLLVGSQIAQASTADPLENLAVGSGNWVPYRRQAISSTTTNDSISPSFIAYATRFLINYDPSLREWWKNLEQNNHLLSESLRQDKQRASFGGLARSLQVSVQDVLEQNISPRQAYACLWGRFVVEYARDDESRRQIALLFALLPPDCQPISRLKAFAPYASDAPPLKSSPLSSINSLQSDLTELLSPAYRCNPVHGKEEFAIVPSFDGLMEQSAATLLATNTPFGPIAELPLIRDQAIYSAATYGRLALSGAIGCTMTHTLVVPLDVVKTRSQTVSAEQRTGLLSTGQRILQEEGIQGLLLGAQATVAGYLWYGATVYPCYALFKKVITQQILPIDFVAANSDGIALVAGALASVVAGVGLTPLEAARIRVVAEPDTYRALGVAGTLRAIATEDPHTGWRSLYAGLPSLLTRQVMFGGVKFLGYERASGFIFSIWPVLREETWTSLSVSLVAGAFAGALSSIVSQPADSVLTKVAQDSKAASRGLLGAGIDMLQSEGIGSLYRGVGSRCIWATCIISGQFLLYDVFRTCSGVSPDNLSQVYQLVLPTN